MQTGRDAGRLTVVFLALSPGLALESRPDPGAVPDDVAPRVLADLLDAAP